LQDIRAMLLVGVRAKLQAYRGRGPLAAWLRRIAANAAWDHVRKKSVDRRSLRALACTRSALVPTCQEDQRILSQRARLCDTAWRHTIESLSTSERQLLRHRYVAGLSIDVLGPMYGLHRATVARRLRRIMESIRSRVRQALSGYYPELCSTDLDALMIESLETLDTSAGGCVGPAQSTAQHGPPIPKPQLEAPSIR
jgi:RNA polymerase sigma-70 factor (ECF subfamily)